MRAIACVLASEETVRGLVDGVARVVAESWSFGEVAGFEPRAGIPAPVAWEKIPFAEGASGGVAIATDLSPSVRAEIAELIGVVTPAIERAVKRETAERYHRHVTPLFDAHVVLDAETMEVLYANEAMAKLRGFSSTTEMAGAIWTTASAELLRRVHPNRRGAYLNGERHRYIDEVALAKKPLAGEDGASVWAEVHSFLHKDEISGKLLVCAQARPLSHADLPPDSGQATLLEELQALALIGAWSVDSVTGDGRWTDQLAKIHEVPAMTNMMDAFTHFTPEGQKVLREKMEGTARTGEPFTVELPITSGAGNAKWVRMHARGVFEHGHVVRIRGTAQDITLRKNAELALASQRAHLQCLLDHLPDVVSFRDLDNRILACNTRLELLLGAGPGELLGTILPNATPATALAGEPLRDERWFTFRHDGHRELVETVTTLIRGNEGEPIGILGMARDITAARNAEEQLRAVQKMEAIGRLAGGVAHDFNNLLSVILSYTNLAIETLPPQHPLQEDFAEILAAGKRGESLTRQLLTFSRRQLLQMRPLVLSEVVDTIGKMLVRLIGEDIDLRFVNDGENAATNVDRGQLEQVLVNLVVNARDAMPCGGKLTISTSSVTLDGPRATRLDLPAGAYLQLSVEDTGMGMDQATLARAFEPFFTTKGVGKGTGLGLSMAYGIVKQSGGAIAIDSIPSVGTKVHIYLPRHLAAPPIASPKPAPANKVRGSETILVVEDEGPLRTVACRILKGVGYEVLSAANAEEALRIAKEVGDRIDLVFTDVVMPGMNGGELVERLTALHPRMKVIFTSGYTDEKLARSGVGEHRFLAKPYEPAQLTQTIRSVLDSGSDIPPA